jgi:hypothetical protein
MFLYGEDSLIAGIVRPSFRVFLIMVINNHRARILWGVMGVHGPPSFGKVS